LQTFVWKLQAGDAVTFPTPWGPTVFIRSRAQWDSDEAFRKHEATHIRQIKRWGAAKYLWLHLWTRLRHFDMFLYNHPIEREAYDAERLPWPDDV